MPPLSRAIRLRVAWPSLEARPLAALVATALVRVAVLFLAAAVGIALFSR